MKWQTVIVRTPEHLGGCGGHSAAVIEAEFDENTFFDNQKPEHSRSRHVIQRIKEAVHDWAQETEAGRRAVESINFDFNFGDLAENLDYFSWESEDAESLDHYLSKAGFLRVKVNTFHDDDDHECSYDDILIDQFVLQEHYKEQDDYDDYDVTKRDLNGPQY